MSYWEEERISDAKSKFALAEAKRLEALKDVDVEKLKAAQPHDPWNRRYVWITVWLTQILVWGFLMMTFKKDVWPR